MTQPRKFQPATPAEQRDALISAAQQYLLRASFIGQELLALHQQLHAKTKEFNEIRLRLAGVVRDYNKLIKHP